MTSNDNKTPGTPEIEVPDFLKPREIGPLLPERAERRRARWWFLAVPVTIAVLMVVVVLQFGSDERPVQAVAVPEFTPAVVPSSESPSQSTAPSTAPPSTAPPSTAPPPSSKRATSPSSPRKTTPPPPRAHRGAIVGIGGRCIAVDRDRAELAVCADRGSQRWTAPGDGTVRAMNRCLDVFASGEANGTPVILYPCNRTDAQQWQRRADGTWRNPQSNKCLSTVGGRSDPGTRLAVYDCGGGAHQRWSLT